MSRRIADCRAFPNEFGCTLTIAGEEQEVLAAAVLHAISVHGHTEPVEELRAGLRAILKDEVAAATV
jgi:predicted small metal-binding protein